MAFPRDYRRDALLHTTPLGGHRTHRLSYVDVFPAVWVRCWFVGLVERLFVFQFATFFTCQLIDFGGGMGIKFVVLRKLVRGFAMMLAKGRGS